MASSSCASGAVPQRAQKRVKLDGSMRIMEEIRSLGYIPKQHTEHKQLARTYQKAMHNGKISPLEQQEAEALTAAHQRLQAETHAEKIMEELRALGHWPSAGRQKKLLKQICEAMVAGNFSTADEATNRLEQDLLKVKSGMRTKEVMRRIRRYKTYFDKPGLQENALDLQYKHQMDRASTAGAYIPPSSEGRQD